ncbi:MAG TPA: sigma-70 family RNA polymerase sigma factor [Chloroflexota bacterium]|jgi:RNA polymerase sigma-70 factor (ECF subfamily)|nr:sigma-70 family RNA polymerase sigma factor [Chloroflexota bacterium]
MSPDRHEDRQPTARGTTLGSAFQENAAKIYSFVYSKVGNREVAEDLTSQVFLKAARWLAEDRSADSIRSWLYTTARSAIADYWQKQSQEQQVSLDVVGDLLFRGTDAPKEVRRTRERAMRILEALPQRERDVLRLRFLHGYSAVEIGQQLGLTPGNVRVLQLRALRRAATMGMLTDRQEKGEGDDER